MVPPWSRATQRRLLLCWSKGRAVILTRLMDTIQKTAAQIIEVIKTCLLGEHVDGEETEAVSRTSAARLAA